MLNVGAGELIFILVAALLILGPKRLPELARSVGKFVREFRRQTDDVRSVVEREFYRMDQEISTISPLERRNAEPGPILPQAGSTTPTAAPGITLTPAPGTTPSATPGTPPVAVAGAGTSPGGPVAGGGSSAPVDASSPTPPEPKS